MSIQKFVKNNHTMKESLSHTYFISVLTPYISGFKFYHPYFSFFQICNISVIKVLFHCDVSDNKELDKVYLYDGNLHIRPIVKEFASDLLLSSFKKEKKLFKKKMLLKFFFLCIPSLLFVLLQYIIFLF